MPVVETVTSNLWQGDQQAGCEDSARPLDGALGNEMDLTGP